MCSPGLDGVGGQRRGRTRSRRASIVTALAVIVAAGDPRAADEAHRTAGARGGRARAGRLPDWARGRGRRGLKEQLTGSTSRRGSVTTGGLLLLAGDAVAKSTRDGARPSRWSPSWRSRASSCSSRRTSRWRISDLIRDGVSSVAAHARARRSSGVVAAGSAAVGRLRGGRAWAVLLGATGGTAAPGRPRRSSSTCEIKSTERERAGCGRRSMTGLVLAAAGDRTQLRIRRRPAGRPAVKRRAAGAHEHGLGALERPDVRLLDRARGHALRPAARHHQARVRAGDARPCGRAGRARRGRRTRAPRATRAPGRGRRRC